MIRDSDSRTRRSFPCCSLLAGIIWQRRCHSWKIVPPPHNSDYPSIIANHCRPLNLIHFTIQFQRKKNSNVPPSSPWRKCQVLNLLFSSWSGSWLITTHPPSLPGCKSGNMLTRGRRCKLSHRPMSTWRPAACLLNSTQVFLTAPQHIGKT